MSGLDGDAPSPETAAGSLSTAQAPPEVGGESGTPDEITSRLGAIEELLQARLRYDATKEEAFRRLYADLEVFKADATAAAFRPIYLDLILVLDRIDQSMPTVDSAEDAMALLSSVREEIAEVLLRRGVSPVESPDEMFDPKTQRAVATEPATAAAQDRTVAAVVRPGYMNDGAVLRPADVVVRKFVQDRGGTDE